MYLMRYEEMIKFKIQYLYNDVYYRENGEIISDHEYDLKYFRLLELERDYPQLIDYIQVTNIVGSDLIDGFKKIRHEIPMLSIKNALNIDQLNDWLESCHNKIIAEYKVDGCSLSLF